MPRLSRAARIARWTLPLTFALFIAMEALSVYVFILNRRVVNELVNRSWRVPTIIVSAAGNREREIARVYGADWRVSPPVVIGELPPQVPNAFLAAEDVRFRSHPGIDPIGIARAVFKNLRAGEIAQGGSTIPQQIIKQHFLTQERTWRRKVVEAVLAVVLDFRLSKDDLLELYLNDVYLGHYQGVPILGIDEAARLYFDKSPRALRPDEAAVLAAMIHAPNRDNPEKRPDIVRARRRSSRGVHPRVCSRASGGFAINRASIRCRSRSSRSIRAPAAFVRSSAAPNFISRRSIARPRCDASPAPPSSRSRISPRSRRSARPRRRCSSMRRCRSSSTTTTRGSRRITTSSFADA